MYSSVLIMYPPPKHLGHLVGTVLGICSDAGISPLPMHTWQMSQSRGVADRNEAVEEVPVLSAILCNRLANGQARQDRPGVDYD